MKSAATSTTAAVGAQRFRHVLVVSQLALALILLTGTGLMLRGFWKLQEVDAGFDPQSVITMSVGLEGSRFSRQATWTRLQEHISTLPGVENAALAATLPTLSPPEGVLVAIEGFTPATGGSVPLLKLADGASFPMAGFYHVVTPQYFSTLGIRLLEGRFFDERDSAQAPRAVVINQTMARMFWGNRSALGHRIRALEQAEWSTVVGVIADVKNDGLNRPTATEFYAPHTQSSLPVRLESAQVAVRYRGDLSLLVNAIRREIKQVDPTLGVTKVRTMEEVLSASHSRPRFIATLLAVFASVALTLAAVGIYGVISYSVARRTREFGIRLALGAQPGTVTTLVLKSGLLLTVCGLAIGLGGAFALTRFLSEFLFGITATDPMTFFAVSLLLGLAAVFACYIPARRATRVDPMIALRTD